jgi:glutathione peroxidase
MSASSVSKITVLAILVVLSGCKDSDKPEANSDVGSEVEKSIYDFTINNIDEEPKSLSDYQGKVLMIVNVASKCGATPQYAQLQKIYQKYSDSGFLVLGFPANNFGNQEPGSNEEIKEFYTKEYQVTFPVFAKISVKGEDIHPLYKCLTEQGTEPELKGDITWNFNKFLLGRDGKILARFPTNVEPDAPELLEAIEQAIESQ